MTRRLVLAVATALMVGAAPAAAQDGFWSRVLDTLGRSSPDARTQSVISNADAEAALRQALEFAALSTADQLSRRDAYWADPAIRIPLPDTLQRAQETLRPLRLSGPIDDLEERMNRAAEAAAPEAAGLIIDAVRAVTVEDALSIVAGDDDAATQYLRGRTEADLMRRFTPVVEDALTQAGAVAQLERLAGRYDLGSLSADMTGRLTQHVVTAALDGVFVTLAAEEAAIRNDPVKRTTDVLRRVFGAS